MEIICEKDQAFRSGDWGVKYLFRGPQTDCGIIVLKSGQTMGCHFHHQVEEIFYVLEGTPVLVVDGKEYPTQPQTAYRIPAPEKHNLRNMSDAPAKILFIKAPFNPDDKVDC
jgi:mannose-6-phosphate isomerase-like protein (cupin superfamily)